ncbi:MAG: hypothetical protein LBC85_02830 [Fibromonadaceae bacterium]|jgi:hypothetical protein|nr:hypothetical protein [Fibromonadaceae bacterium]
MKLLTIIATPMHTAIARARLALPLLCLLLFATSLFATQARVESMGKRSAFFLDDVSIFSNPANATLYSNTFMGELGFYSQNSLGTADVGFRRDPFNPWFGALFRNELSNEGLRDPQITIGGFFQRDRPEFARFIPRKVVVMGDTISIPQTITNFDAFLAGTMVDGSAVGAHVYVGLQNGKQDDDVLADDAHTSVLTMDYGANFLITNRSSVELSFGIARIQYGPVRKSFLDSDLFSFYSQGRLFLEMDAWHGHFITGYKVADIEVPGWNELSLNLNTGFNVIIHRGQFWFGLDAVHVRENVGTWEKFHGEDDKGRPDNFLIYREPNPKEEIVEDASKQFGGILSFGIERNIWKNWLLVRAGAQKSVIYKTCHNNTDRSASEGGVSAVCPSAGDKKGRYSYWTTNPYNDGTLDDHLGFGVGLNIDNKLKIDASVAEDIFFRNPFTQTGRFLSRISAIYVF